MFKNATDVLQNIRIPESDNAIAFRGKSHIADFILLAFRVLPSIDFNSDGFIPANKVGDIRSDFALPNEFESA